MTDNRLRTLIDAAVELDREVQDKTERLKELKAQLIAEAESRQEEQRSIEGSDGIKWVYNGNGGCIVRVTFPAAKLKASIDPSSKAGEKVLSIAGTSKLQLFTTRLLLEPVPSFRDLAREILGGKAEKLITLCETTSSPRVEFETKPESE